MQTITPFLWFDDKAEEAANFYTSIFKNSKITATSRYGDAGPGPKGSVMTVAFQLDGQEFLALNGGPLFKFTEAISFVVNCETQREVDEFWDEAVRRRSGGPVRVAEGPVRPLMADRAEDPERAGARQGSAEGAARHEGDAADEEDRHPGSERRVQRMSVLARFCVHVRNAGTQRMQRPSRLLAVSTVQDADRSLLSRDAGGAAACIFRTGSSSAFSTTATGGVRPARSRRDAASSHT